MASKNKPVYDGPEVEAAFSAPKHVCARFFLGGFRELHMCDTEDEAIEVAKRMTEGRDGSVYVFKCEPVARVDRKFVVTAAAKP